MLLALSGGGDVTLGETWERYPWVSLSAGYENDRILEQGTGRLVVPGGNFLTVTPGALFSRPFGRRARLNLDGQFTFEQFNNDDYRSLFSAAANGELRYRLGTRWRWRLTAGGNYFADSVQETVNRFHGGAEAAFGFTGPRGYLEALAGAQGRRFPNLVSLDDSGIPGTYTELGASVGATGAVRPIGRIVLSGLVMGQTTDARDPAYDAESLLAQAAVRVAMPGRLWIYASGMTQERSFSARSPGEDTDSYRQLGAGVEYPLGRSFDLSLRYAFARYTDPLGNEDDIQRFSFGVTWWPGGRGIRSLPPVIPAIGQTEDENRIRENEPHLFRVYAPTARSVALISDFNDWNPHSNVMQETGDGWWEARIALPAGTYQYAYWVDGNLVTPPEAGTTVDDGFGGENGLLHVEPDAL